MNQDKFRCSTCKKIFNLNTRYPIVNLSHEQKCRACYEQKGYKFNIPGDDKTLFIVELKNELLNPDCCHSADNTPGTAQLIEAVSIDINTFKVYCAFCPKGESDRISLEDYPARFYLKFVLSNLYKDTRYPREYCADFKAKFISNEPSAKDILTCLKRKRAYDSETLICIQHLNPVSFIDEERFLFQCAICSLRSPCPVPDLFFHFEKAKLICREAKTCAFTSTILNVLKNDNPRPKECKDFLLDMEFLMKNRNDNLDAKSRCLHCQDLFNLGEKTPIQLHQEEKHEVCYACFISGQVRECPIDKTPVNDQIKPARADFLYKIRAKMCILEHTDRTDQTKYFSYYKNSPPYRIHCGHNICSGCVSNSKERKVLECSKCELPMTPGDETIDEFIVQQLKFIELFCDNPDHSGMGDKYYNIDQCLVYCQKCKFENKYRNFQNPSLFSAEINKKLYNLSLESNNLMLREVAEKLFLYTLSSRLGLYRYIANETGPNLINVQMDPKILPLTFESFSYWTPHRTEAENLQIKSNAILEVYGLLVGKGVRNSGEIQITFSDGSWKYGTIEAAASIEDKIQGFMFDEPLLLKSMVEIYVGISAGEYFHGYGQRSDDGVFKANSRINLDENRYIEFFSNSNVNGCFANGGPVIGLVISKFSILQ